MTMRTEHVDTAHDATFRTSRLEPNQDLPLIIEPAVPGAGLASWVRDRREMINEMLLGYGALLFRNFRERSTEEFQECAQALSLDLLDYSERSSPRSQVQGRVYTSTEYPADQVIYLHNENSYQRAWPLKILFFCVTAPEEGGETPIADCRKVYRRIDPEIRQRFLDKKWMVVRNFGDGFGLPWQTVFQTSSKEAVEHYCHDNGIEVEWKSGDRLRTRAIRPAIGRHPSTGELSWFNHATFFHVSTLSPMLREALECEFDSELDYPSSSYYGDGSPIEDATMEHLRAAYAQEKVAFRWREGDLLMLDNFMVAHAREPFSGPRRIVVGMAQPQSWDDIAQ